MTARGWVTPADALEPRVVKKRMQTSLAQHYAGLLQQTWRSTLGAAAFGHDGRLLDWRAGLLPSLVDLAEDEVSGLFDPSRLRQPETAAAMALNSFLPWRAVPERLEFAGHGPFTELRFFARCPTGVRGTPPLLDLLATSRTDLVAVAAHASPGRTRRAPCGAAAQGRRGALPDGHW
jgi:hypothetical protein